MKEAFINKKRTANTLAAIKQIDDIVEEYSAQGFRMTVRQIFYQHVARDLLPNTGKSYDIVQRNARRGREEGLIDGANMEDRNRETKHWLSYISPEEALEVAAKIYAEDPWVGQRYRPHRLDREGSARQRDRARLLSLARPLPRQSRLRFHLRAVPNSEAARSPD